MGPPPPLLRSLATRHGCASLWALLAVAIAGAVLAFRHPLAGVPLVVAAVAAGGFFLVYSARLEREEQDADTARLRSVAAPTGDAWRRLLDAEGLGAHAEALAGLVRPAVRLTATPAGGLRPGQSRIGGLPDVPAGFEWPVHQGQPLSFLAQIDLAEARRAMDGGELPDGHLWFFYVADQSAWGYDPKHAGSSRVLYSPADVSLAPAAPPEELSVEHLSCAVAFDVYDDLPDLEDRYSFKVALSESQEERYNAVRSFLASGGASTEHKLLGHPQPVQGPMELECALVTNGLYCGDASGYRDPRARELEGQQRQWRLLLQLDSDDAADMMWGDGGMLYFWIREADLRERRFERAWMILQCH